MDASSRVNNQSVPSLHSAASASASSPAVKSAFKNLELLRRQMGFSESFKDVKAIHEALVAEMVNLEKTYHVEDLRLFDIIPRGDGSHLLLIDAGGMNILIDHLVKVGKLPEGQVAVCPNLESLSPLLSKICIISSGGQARILCHVRSTRML